MNEYKLKGDFILKTTDKNDPNLDKCLGLDKLTANLFYVCDKCKKIYLFRSNAAKCCTINYICERCGFDGSKTNPPTELINNKYCINCIDIVRKENAVKIKYDGQPLFYDDNYYLNEDDLLENLLNKMYTYDLMDLDPFFWGCKEDKWEGIDLYSCLEKELSEHDEDIYNSIVDLDALEKFLADWNKKQKIVSYYPDYKTIIDISEYIHQYLIN